MLYILTVSSHDQLFLPTHSWTKEPPKKKKEEIIYKGNIPPPYQKRENKKLDPNQRCT